MEEGFPQNLRRGVPALPQPRRPPGQQDQRPCSPCDSKAATGERGPGDRGAPFHASCRPSPSVARPSARGRVRALGVWTRGGAASPRTDLPHRAKPRFQATGVASCSKAEEQRSPTYWTFGSSGVGRLGSNPKPSNQRNRTSAAMKVPTVLVGLAALAAAATGSAAAPLAGPTPSPSPAAGPPIRPPPNVEWVCGGCMPRDHNINAACQTAAPWFSGDFAAGSSADCGTARGFWCGSFVDPAAGFYPGQLPDGILPGHAKWFYRGCATDAAPARCPQRPLKTYEGFGPDHTACPEGNGLWCAY
ncbi:hypothetical protein DFJ74DRAFT_665398 [Hyaloraphidium curvatum]|nr:hypothetical protein DFJ74DRAFT_665398 [Hyaloraphidium curvatum]